MISFSELFSVYRIISLPLKVRFCDLLSKVLCLLKCVHWYHFETVNSIQVLPVEDFTQFISISSDDEDPVIECPDDIEVDADPGQNYATVTWFPPNVTDNSGEAITPMLSHSSGSQFPFGPTTVIVNASDSHSNTVSCNFTVNVLGKSWTKKHCSF